MGGITAKSLTINGFPYYLRKPADSCLVTSLYSIDINCTVLQECCPVLTSWKAKCSENLVAKIGFTFDEFVVRDMGYVRQAQLLWNSRTITQGLKITEEEVLPL